MDIRPVYDILPRLLARLTKICRVLPQLAAPCAPPRRVVRHCCLDGRNEIGVL
jgi:hypothetical protein